MNAGLAGRRRRQWFWESGKSRRKGELSPCLRRLGVELLEDRRMLSVLFVDHDALPGGDGLSWGSAYVSIQDALDRAEVLNADADAENDIGAVWIAEGVYVPSKDKHGSDSPDDGRTVTFSLVSQGLTPTALQAENLMFRLHRYAAGMILAMATCALLWSSPSAPRYTQSPAHLTLYI